MNQCHKDLRISFGNFGFVCCSALLIDPYVCYCPVGSPLARKLPEKEKENPSV